MRRAAADVSGPGRQEKAAAGRTSKNLRASTKLQCRTAALPPGGEVDGWAAAAPLVSEASAHRDFAHSWAQKVVTSSASLFFCFQASG